MRVFHKYGVVLMLLLLILFISGVSVEHVNAAETDTTWQKGYEYSLDKDNNIITLNKYIGLDTDLIVYGSAVIEGVKYRTALKSAGSYDGGIWYDKRTSIEVLEFYDPVQLPADCSYMFYGCSSLTNLNVSKFNTTGVTNMTGMFYGCSGLTDLNLSSFSITTSNCTDLLTGATGLTLLNTPTRTVSSIVLPVSMKELNCSTGALGAETSALASGQSVSKVLVVGAITHSWDISMNNDGSIMAYLFNTGLLYITGDGEFLNFDGSTGASDDDENVSTYSSAFVCSNLYRFGNTLQDNKVIPSQWRQYKIVPWAFKDIRANIAEVVFDGDMNGSTAFIFSSIESVRAIDFSRATVNTVHTYCSFTECTNLVHIIGIKNYTLLDTMYSGLNSTFRGCSSLKGLDLSHWNTSKINSLNYTFQGCTSLTYLNLSGWDTCNVNDMACTFHSCASLEEIDISHFDTSKVESFYGTFSMYGYPNNKLRTIKLGDFGSDIATNFGWLFYNCQQLENLEFTSFNTKASERMDNMFAHCKSLNEIDLKGFNTSKVTTMDSMFRNCAQLTKLDLNNFNTSSVTNMSYMFTDCSSLKTLNISNFDTSSVTNMACMFQFCTSLVDLDLSNFNTENVTNMTCMFSMYTKPNSLKSLNVSSFKTSSATDISYMFYGCNKLSELDLSNFSISSTINVTDLFYNCKSLHCLKAPSNCSADVKLPMAMRELKLATNSIGSDVFDNLPKTQSESKSLIVGSHSCDENHVCKICGYRGYLFSYNSKSYCTATSDYTWDISKDQNGSVNAYLFSDGLLYITGNSEMIDWQASAGYTISNSNVSTNNTVIAAGVYTPTSTGVHKSYTPTKWASEKMVPWSFKDIKDKIKTVYFKGNFSGSATCLFGNCDRLVKVDFNEYTGKLNNFAASFIGADALSEVAGIEKLDTSNVTSMYDMFGFCSSLTSLNFSNFNTSNVTDMSYMFYGCSGLTSLDVSKFDTSKITDMSFMFYGCSGLTSLNLSNFNTSNVTDMRAMFYNCSGLTSLDVSKFDTSKVTDMSFMFRGCSGLELLNLRNFNTANVTNMRAMFNLCSKLTGLNLSNFNTSNVTNMRAMFEECSGLTNLNISSFNTGKVTNMSIMFNNCSSLKTLDVSNFNMSGVTDVTDMLTNCTSLHYLKTPINNTSDIALPVTLYEFNKAANIVATTGVPAILAGQIVSKDLVTNSHDWDGPLDTECNICGFQRNAQSSFVYNGVTYNLADAKYRWDISKRQDGSVKALLFNDGLLYITGNGKLIDWQISASYNDEVDNVSTNSNPITYEIFGYDADTIHPEVTYTPTSWVEEQIVPWSFVNIKDTINCVAFDGTITGSMSFMFAGLKNLTTVDFTNCTCSAHGMVLTFCSCSNLSEIKSIHNLDVSNSFSFAHTFRLCSSLQELDLSQFDTSKAEYMQSMFYNCSSLTSLDVSKFDTRLVTKMHGMFYGCSSLTSLDVSKFNTKLVDNMNCMFYNCNKLTNLDVSNFDTSNVKNMSFMFWGCNNLSSLDVSKFDTSNVTTLLSMFKNCSKLPNLDVSNWNTSKVKDMSSMFYGCSKLASIDVSKFNTSSVTSMKEMFRECSSLTRLDVSKFDTSSVTDMGWMFYKCSGLLNLDLSNFNTSNVLTVRSMFNGCSKLTSIDLSSFNMSNVTNVSYMFTGCSSLHYLKTPINNTLNISLPLTFYDFNKSANVIFRVGIESIASNQVVSKNLVTHKHAYNSERVCTICGYINMLLVTLDGKDYYSDQATHVWDISKAQDCSVLAFLFEDGLLYVTGTGEMIDWQASAGNCPDNENISTNNTAITKSVYSPTYITISKKYTPTKWASEKMVPWGFKDIRDKIKTVYFKGSFSGSAACLFGKCTNLARVDFTEYTGKLNNFALSFIACNKLSNIEGIKNLDTSNVTSMMYTFSSCSSLTSLDVSNFDTSNVTNMFGMFYNCSSLTSLDLTKFDTSKVTDMSNMFDSCSNLTSLDVSNFDTSKVTDMSCMFINCSKLTSLNLSNFDMSKVTNVMYMLTNCTSLHYLKTPTNNTLNIALPATYYEFNKAANSISETDITMLASGQTVSKDLVTAAHVDEDSNFKCDICGYVIPRHFVVDGKDYYSNQSKLHWDISKAQDSSVMAYLFNDGLMYITGDGEMIDWVYSAAYSDAEDNVSTNTNSITHLIYPIKTPSQISVRYTPTKWRPQGIVPWGFVDIKDLIKVVYCDGNFSGNMSCMFAGLSKLTTLNLTKYTGKPTSFKQVLIDCTSLKTIDGLNTVDTSKVAIMDRMFYGCSSLVSLDLSDFYTDSVIYMAHMFTNCSSLTSLDLSNFNTSKVTDMAYMFAGCSSLTSLDLSDFDTSSVNNMEFMFTSCSSLTSLDLGSFDTSKVTNMKYMFTGCSGLTGLDLSNFNTSNVTDVYVMFAGCSGLISLDISNFNTSKVTNMFSLFAGCSSLTSLDLSNFDTSSVTEMDNMFAMCSNLTSIDLSSFNTSNVNTMEGMFSSCSGLTSLNLRSFNTGNVHQMSGMFYNCSGLSSLDLSSFDMSKVTGADEMLTGTDSLATLNTPKNCALALDLPYKMYDVDNVSYTSIPNLTTSIELTKDPKFDYKVSIPTNVVLMADIEDGDGIDSSTRFIASPNIIVHGSAGNMKLAIKSHDVNDNAGEMTLRDGDNTMQCAMKFTDTDSCIFDLYTDRLTAEQKQDASGDGLLIPLELLATGLNTTGRYEGSLEFEFSRIP